MIPLILNKELLQNILRKRRKRKWSHKICKKGKVEGKFAILYKKLIDDE